MWTFESRISKNVYILVAKKATTPGVTLLRKQVIALYLELPSLEAYTLSLCSIPTATKGLGKARGPFSGLQGPLSH